MRCAYDIKFEMLQVHENEISLRKWSGGTAHAQVVWWYCACASGLVVLRMRTSGGNIAPNPTERLIFWLDHTFTSHVVASRDVRGRGPSRGSGTIWYRTWPRPWAEERLLPGSTCKVWEARRHHSSQERQVACNLTVNVSSQHRTLLQGA